VALFLCIFSAAVANQGLAQLIEIAGPVLVALYPPAIALVSLSLLQRWQHPARVYIPVMLVALVFGLADGAKALQWAHLLPSWLEHLPGAALGLGWVTPVAATVVCAGLADWFLARRQIPVRP
jgi:LIVCS family branched-chain amino acid:cation transporter